MVIVFVIQNILRINFSQNYTVENTPKWSVGDTDDWQYKTKDEKEYIIEEEE